MAAPTLLKINGVDFAPYVKADGGFQWEQNDIQSENTGRTMDGMMHIEWVSTKVKITVSLIDVTHTEAQPLLTALQPGWKIVEIIDPYLGSYSGTFYCGNRKGTFTRYDDDAYWKGIGFSLIEK